MTAEPFDYLTPAELARDEMMRQGYTTEEPLPDPGTDRRGGEAVDQMRSRLLTVGQLRNLPKPRWLLDGIIPERSTGMLFGKGESYKSFLALGWHLSIAEGLPWEADAYYPVQQVNGVYVAGEGAFGTPARVDAWEQFHKHTVGDAMLWYPAPVNLFRREQVEAFAQAVADHEPGLIIFDTLAKCAVGADENSARDMGVVHDSMNWLNRELGCASAVIHHNTKDGSQYRGSSALFDNVDWAVKVERQGREVTVTSEKQKDAPHFADINLEAFEMGDSLVLRYVAQTSTGIDRADDLLELLCQVSAIEGVSGTKFQEMADTELKIPKRSYYRLINGLVTKGYAQNIGTEKRAVLRATAAGRQLVRASGAT